MTENTIYRTVRRQKATTVNPHFTCRDCEHLGSSIIFASWENMICKKQSDRTVTTLTRRDDEPCSDFKQIVKKEKKS
jgi:hypothetical protein